MSKSKLARIVVLVTIEEKRNLKRYAKKKETTMGEIIRESISRVPRVRA